MPTTSINMPLPQVSGINQLPSARKTAPKPKSRGSSGSIPKVKTKRKYQKKKMEYWNKLGRKEGKKNKKETRG